MRRIAETDTTTLLAFRQLSRCWRDFCDARLFRHVLIGRPAKEFEFQELAALRDGQSPPADHGLEFRTPHPPYDRLPLLPFNRSWSPSGDTSVATNHSRERALKHVEAIDYHGAYTKDLQGLLPNLCLLRRQWPKALPSSAPVLARTVVDQVDFTHPSYSELVDTGLETLINHGIKHYILRIKFVATDPPVEVPIKVVGKPQKVEIVLEPEEEEGENPQNAYFLVTLLKNIQELALGGIPVTVAGVERFEPAQVHFGNSETVINKLKEKLLADIEDSLVDGGAGSDSSDNPFSDARPIRSTSANDVLSKVTFVTLNDWHESHQTHDMSRLLAAAGSSYVQPGNDSRWYHEEYYSAYRMQTPSFYDQPSLVQPTAERYPVGSTDGVGVYQSDTEYSDYECDANEPDFLWNRPLVL